MERPAVGATGPVFARRASNVLALAAVLTLVAFLLLVGAGASQVPRPELVAAVVGVIASGALFTWLSIALDRDRAWAPGAAALVLWVAILTGAVQVVLALAGGQLLVPLDALVAGWALSSPDRPPVRLRGAPVLVGILVVAAVAGRIGGPVVGAVRAWGLADASDIRLTITTDCAAAAADPDAPLVARVAWSWDRAELIPPAQDAIEVSWADDADGRVYSLPWTPAPGIDADAPGIAMRALDGNSNGIPYERYGFDPAQHPAGSLDIPFEVDRSAGPVLVSLAVQYAHGDAWTRAEGTDCELPGAAGAGPTAP